MKRILATFSFVFLMFTFGFPLLTSAQDTTPVVSPAGTDPVISPGGTVPVVSPAGTGGTTLHNPLAAKSFSDFIDKLIALLIDVGYVVVVLALVYCGFLFVAAQGKEEKLREARAALLWTVIGGLILLGANVIRDVIQSTAEAL